LKDAIDAYMIRVSGLGGNPVSNGGLIARHFSPEIASTRMEEMVQAIEALAADATN